MCDIMIIKVSSLMPVLWTPSSSKVIPFIPFIAINIYLFIKTNQQRCLIRSFLEVRFVLSIFQDILQQHDNVRMLGLSWQYQFLIFILFSSWSWMKHRKTVFAWRLLRHLIITIRSALIFTFDSKTKLDLSNCQFYMQFK